MLTDNAEEKPPWVIAQVPTTSRFHRWSEVWAQLGAQRKSWISSDSLWVGEMALEEMALLRQAALESLIHQEALKLS